MLECRPFTFPASLSSSGTGDVTDAIAFSWFKGHGMVIAGPQYQATSKYQPLQLCVWKGGSHENLRYQMLKIENAVSPTHKNRVLFKTNKYLDLKYKTFTVYFVSVGK